MASESGGGGQTSSPWRRRRRARGMSARVFFSEEHGEDLETIPCPCCGNDDSAVYRVAHDRLFGRPGRHRVVLHQRDPRERARPGRIRRRARRDGLGLRGDEPATPLRLRAHRPHDGARHRLHRDRDDHTPPLLAVLGRIHIRRRTRARARADARQPSAAAASLGKRSAARAPAGSVFERRSHIESVGVCASAVHFATLRCFPEMSAKKSLPLSSTTTNAGKSTTSIFHTASMPSSG